MPKPLEHSLCAAEEQRGAEEMSPGWSCEAQLKLRFVSKAPTTCFAKESVLQRDQEPPD